ncbi:MAG: hypothetical protein PHT07_10365 [Paludibacter sp.]|nr:hypothetical protein [Paludibacter sp.]
MSRGENMTKSTYSAILIDPFTQTILSVNVERGKNELKNIYSLLGCSMIETVSPSFGNNGDRLVVDEEGLFKEDQACFYTDGLKLYGKALYVGTRGSLFDTPEISIEELGAKINFNADPFRGWLETFLDEKGIGVEHTFEYDISNNFVMVSVGAIVDQVCYSDAHTKETVKQKIVEIDFVNGNVLDFFSFLGKYIAQQQVQSGCLKSA